MCPKKFILVLAFFAPQYRYQSQMLKIYKYMKC